jgi:hypothetical protein
VTRLAIEPGSEEDLVTALLRRRHSVRPIVIVLDPMPLDELTDFVGKLKPLLGADGVADAALGRALGVRFAFRGKDGPTAADVRPPEPIGGAWRDADAGHLPLDDDLVLFVRADGVTVGRYNAATPTNVAYWFDYLVVGDGDKVDEPVRWWMPMPVAPV